MSKRDAILIICVILVVLVLSLFWAGILPLSWLRLPGQVKRYDSSTLPSPIAQRPTEYTSNQNLAKVDRTAGFERIIFSGTVEKIEQDPSNNFTTIGLRSTSMPLVIVKVLLGAPEFTTIVKNNQIGSKEYKTEKTMSTSALVGLLRIGETTMDVTVVPPKEIGLNGYEKELLILEQTVIKENTDKLFMVPGIYISKIAYY